VVANGAWVAPVAFAKPPTVIAIAPERSLKSVSQGDGECGFRGWMWWLVLLQNGQPLDHKVVNA